MTLARWAALLLAACCTGCGTPPGNAAQANFPSAITQPWFRDVSAQVGIDFLHDAGPVGDFFMPQQVGSGAALFDFNNDGRLDIYLLNNGGPHSKSLNRLYRQNAEHTFDDVTAGSGLDINGYNMGVAVGDANNDGWIDLLVTQYSGAKLLLNEGGEKFRDISQEAGIDVPSWAASAAFFDYDRDGWLDLVVAGYVDYDPTWPCKGPSGAPDYCAPKTFKGRVSRLFHNASATSDARSVKFDDVTIPSGLGEIPGPGLGVYCADLSGDGWPDIFISNDGEPNRLWINQHDGTFSDESITRGVAYNMQGQAHAGMGIAAGDVNRDGLLDLIVTHLAQETHALWVQDPPGVFTDKTALSGLLQSEWRGTGFGSLLGDFRNAGYLDLAIVNGAVAAQTEPGDPALGPFWSQYGQRNQVFAGSDTGEFSDVSSANPDLCGYQTVARGLAKGDFDGDGGLDLLVTSIAGKARLFKNIASDRGHWISIRAYDPALNRDALGSVVTVRAGSKTSAAWLHPCESYLCSSEPRAHFGLGSIGQIENVEILWPDGARERFKEVGIDRQVELRRGAGEQVAP